MTPTSDTTDQELRYRESLALVRALVASDEVAAETIARYADSDLLERVAGVCLYLFLANVDDPLRVIDALFDSVPETLVLRATLLRLWNASGKSDEAAS